MNPRNSVSPIWQYRGLIFNFASRELKGKYRGSFLGSIWSLINPLATLATYSLVFGFFLKFPTPAAGNGSLRSFPIFLFTALVVWNFFYSLCIGSMGALLASGGLLRKIYFPPFAPIFGSGLAILNQTAIEFSLLLIILVAVLNVGWTVLLLPVLLIFLAAFGLGVGLILAIFNARLRDVNYIVTVVLNLAFYTAPIIYPISLVRDRYPAHPWLKLYEYNPITVFVESFRDILWDLQAPSLFRMLYMIVVSFGVLIIGWLFFQRNSADISEEL